MQLSNIYENLPMDIVNKILLLDGKITNRNGKYINKISKSDKRYEILSAIPTFSTGKIGNIFYCVVNFEKIHSRFLIYNKIDIVMYSYCRKYFGKNTVYIRY